MKICTKCGYIGEAQAKYGCGGCLGIIFVWILFGLVSILFWPILLIPIIYTAYIIITDKNARCPKCKNDDCMIPLDSPAGRQLEDQYYEKDEDE